MIRLSLLALPLAALTLLPGCREETAALPEPVAMTEEAVGHYCQMHLLEHAGPKAQVHLDGNPYPLFFSQVRDAIAYQRMPEQSHFIAAIYVSDMGAEGATWQDPGAMNWIEAGQAHYVVGAAIEGGMGAPELVPFAERERAESFAAEHGGQVLALAEIGDGEVLAPVEFEGDIGADDDDEGDFEERLRALSGQSGG
ncbi:MAG: nitrous oxide reductase accessory protein NosL [Pararhodobacter sp.]|nr:nitrous oxide reductase accessory protein NosL [Pararhodobacter sp.]